MRVLAFRHAPVEGLGPIEPALRARGVPIDYLDTCQPGAVTPSAADCAALIWLRPVVGFITI